jgi:hypothetical protein
MKPYGRPTGWRNKIHDTNKCGICAETRVIKKKSRQNELMIIMDEIETGSLGIWIEGLQYGHLSVTGADNTPVYMAPFLQLTPSKLLKATWPIKAPRESKLVRVETKSNGEVDYIFDGNLYPLEDRYFIESFTLLPPGLKPDLEFILSYKHPSIGTTFVYETKKPAI